MTPKPPESPPNYKPMTERQRQLHIEWLQRCKERYRDFVQVWDTCMADFEPADTQIAEIRGALAKLDLEVFRGYRLMFTIRMENFAPTTREQPVTPAKPSITDIANLFGDNK